MDNGNGSGGSLESVTFRIGGKDYEVPELTLYVLDAERETLQALNDQSQTMSDYSRRILRVAASSRRGAPDEKGEYSLPDEYPQFSAVCTYREALRLPELMNRLLAISGFISPLGEEEAASRGTGTLTDLSPSLPFGEFVEPIQE